MDDMFEIVFCFKIVLFITRLEMQIQLKSVVHLIL